MSTLLAAGNCLSITCDECREIERNRAQVQMDLSRKEKDLDRHLQRRDVRQVTEIRKQINELRRTLMGVKAKEDECKTACRPDVLKDQECHKLMEQIAGMESQEAASQSETRKIDALYGELSKCNQELKKLREASTQKD